MDRISAALNSWHKLESPAIYGYWHEIDVTLLCQRLSRKTSHHSTTPNNNNESFTRFLKWLICKYSMGTGQEGPKKGPLGPRVASRGPELSGGGDSRCMPNFLERYLRPWMPQGH